MRRMLWVMMDVCALCCTKFNPEKLSMCDRR